MWSVMNDQTKTLKTACRCAQFCMLRMSLCVVSLLSLSTMVSMMLKVYLSLYTLLRSHLFVNCCIRRYSLYMDNTKTCRPACQLETICALVRWILKHLLLVRKPWQLPLHLCHSPAPWSLRRKTLLRSLVIHPESCFCICWLVSLLYQLTSLPWQLGRCRLLHEI